MKIDCADRIELPFCYLVFAMVAHNFHLLQMIRVVS